MTNLQKNLLTALGSLLLIVLSVFIIASTNKVLRTSTTNTLSVPGEGKVLAKPDTALVNFAIITEEATSKAAQDANSSKSRAVTDFLKKHGLEDKDVKTTGYNIYPQYVYPVYRIDNPETRPPTIKGYRVSQSFQVKIRDLDKASEIVDGLVTAGANDITQLQFAIDDLEKLKEEARALAIADAKEKAEKLEDQTGIRLEKIINFFENASGYPIPYYAKTLEAGGRGGEGPSLPSGENEIVINVTLTYQIK